MYCIIPLIVDHFKYVKIHNTCKVSLLKIYLLEFKIKKNYKIIINTAIYRIKYVQFIWLIMYLSLTFSLSDSNEHYYCADDEDSSNDTGSDHVYLFLTRQKTNKKKTDRQSIEPSQQRSVKVFP